MVAVYSNPHSELELTADDVVFISLLIPCTFGIEHDVITSVPRK